MLSSRAFSATGFAGRDQTRANVYDISCVCLGNYSTWGHSDFFVSSAKAAMLCLFVPFF